MKGKPSLIAEFRKTDFDVSDHCRDENPVLYQLNRISLFFALFCSFLWREEKLNVISSKYKQKNLSNYFLYIP